LWNASATGLQPGSDNDALVYKEFPTTNIPAALAALRVGANVLAIRGLQSGTGSSDFVQRFKLDGDVGGTPATPGGVSPVAQAYTGPISITSGVTIRARLVDTASGFATPETSATFVVDTVPATASNIVVSEINYNPSSPTTDEVTAGFIDDKDFEFLEVTNISNVSVDMDGVTFSEAFNFEWPSTDPSLRVLPPGGRAVIVGTTAGFNFRYNPPSGVKVAGVMDGNLSNGGERIVITGTVGTIKDFSYSDSDPWPAEPDGMGYTLVLNNPSANPDHNVPQNWRCSAEVNGTPGAPAGPAGPTGSAAEALADTDGDGITDLVEFATGTLANNGASQHAPSAQVIPLIVPPAVDPEDYLTFSYTRSRSADGFSFEPEFSSTTSDWQPLATEFTLVSQVNNPDGTVTLTWRSNDPADTLASRLFFLVRAGINP
jgi:hypothetical protein